MLTVYSSTAYPENIALASHLESVVRLHGGIPATVGVLNGVARVGLDTEQIIELASSAGKPETMKVSTRDLSYICGLVRIYGSLLSLHRDLNLVHRALVGRN